MNHGSGIVRLAGIARFAFLEHLLANAGRLLKPRDFDPINIIISSLNIYLRKKEVGARARV